MLPVAILLSPQAQCACACRYSETKIVSSDAGTQPAGAPHHDCVVHSAHLGPRGWRCRLPRRIRGRPRSMADPSTQAAPRSTLDTTARTARGPSRSPIGGYPQSFGLAGGACSGSPARARRRRRRSALPPRRSPGRRVSAGGAQIGAARRRRCADRRGGKRSRLPAALTADRRGAQRLAGVAVASVAVLARGQGSHGRRVGREPHRHPAEAPSGLAWGGPGPVARPGGARSLTVPNQGLEGRMLCGVDCGL